MPPTATSIHPSCKIGKSSVKDTSVKSGEDIDEEVSDTNDVQNQDEWETKKKRRKKQEDQNRKRKGGIRLEEEEVEEEEEGKNSEEKKKEEQEKQQQLEQLKEKEKADSLWADFMKDVGGSARPKPKDSGNSLTTHGSSNTPGPTSSLPSHSKPRNQVTITKVFDFAGEEVRITKEVDANSMEAKASAKKAEENKDGTAGQVWRKPLGGRQGGLASIVGKISGKKTKMGTLEKSKIDWSNFKKEENIEEELKTYNKGKDGYLEKLDFLERTDLRQFEIEKNLRNARRSHR